MPLDPLDDDATQCVRPPQTPRSVSHPLAPSIELSSVYQLDDIEQIDGISEGRLNGYFYARDGHPNATQLAGKLAALEHAEAGLVCASGMAAISASILSLVSQGDHVALADGLYGKSSTLVSRELARFGVAHDLFDPARPDTLSGLLTPRTRLIFAETISNPLLRVCDLKVVGEIARASNVPLVVDHTFAPLLCRPVEFGATLVIHSLTKLIGGHSDLTLGAVVGPREVIERVRSVASTFGQTGNPFDSWLAMRGLSTLSLRSERACSNAFELARRLETHPHVIRTIYPGLPSHPDHQVARQLFSQLFGAMVTCDVGSRDNADRLIRSLRHIPFAPSLGDVQTTLSHPCSSSHRGQDAEALKRLGVSPGLVRLSVGLEGIEDIWDDLKQGLDHL